MVSTRLWIVSDSIAADPVKYAATAFVVATSKLPISAATTERVPADASRCTTIPEARYPFSRSIQPDNGAGQVLILARPAGFDPRSQMDFPLGRGKSKPEGLYP